MLDFPHEHVNKFRSVIETAVDQSEWHGQHHPGHVAIESNTRRASFGGFTFEVAGDYRWSLTAARQYCGKYTGSLLLASTVEMSNSLYRNWQFGQNDFTDLSRQLESVSELMQAVDVATSPHLHLSTLHELGTLLPHEITGLERSAAIRAEATAQLAQDEQAIRAAERGADPSQFIG